MCHDNLFEKGKQCWLFILFELISIGSQHWNGKVIKLMEFSSLATLGIVKMPTGCAAIDSKFVSVDAIWGHRVGFNTLRQDGHHFPDNIFICIFLNENLWISIKVWLTFVPKGPINNITAFVQIIAWCRPGDKPLFESVVALITDTYMCHLASMS